MVLIMVDFYDVLTKVLTKRPLRSPYWELSERTRGGLLTRPVRQTSVTVGDRYGRESLEINFLPRFLKGGRVGVWKLYCPFHCGVCSPDT